ncbi:hypothetical protein QT971_19010 [Microcoleus sp. herbarium19]
MRQPTPDRACTLVNSADSSQFYRKIQCSKKYIKMVEFSKKFVLNFVYLA